MAIKINDLNSNDFQLASALSQLQNRDYMADGTLDDWKWDDTSRFASRCKDERLHKDYVEARAALNELRKAETAAKKVLGRIENKYIKAFNNR